jgi:selenide, water dikinase
MGPGDLDKALCGLPLLTDANVIRGMESLDNAGVYKLRKGLALVQTIDFFTPVVDDPYVFGQIAAANSLSDIYTMGGTPVTAMNIVCFPTGKLDISVLHSILEGGIDKMKEAGVILIGGHTVTDDELKYGLSVTGTVNPKKLITNGGARAGDKLILTKPLGTGIINTAMKAKKASKRTVETVSRSMATLNKTASELMMKLGATACTDITGFGLIGHAQQMAKNSGVGFKLDTISVPFFPEAKLFAQKGLCPGGLHRNRDYYTNILERKGPIPDYMMDILNDPQTSGGLLIAIAPEKSSRLIRELRQSGLKKAATIGEVISQSKGKIILYQAAAGN